VVSLGRVGVFVALGCLVCFVRCGVVSVRVLLLFFGWLVELLMFGWVCLFLIGCVVGLSICRWAGGGRWVLGFVNGWVSLCWWGLRSFGSLCVGFLGGLGGGLCIFFWLVVFCVSGAFGVLVWFEVVCLEGYGGYPPDVQRPVLSGLAALAEG